MRKFYFGFFGVFALTYLAYLTWLTGYRAGYGQGANEAWDTARKALTPHLTQPTDYTTPTAMPVLSKHEPIAVTGQE